MPRRRFLAGTAAAASMPLLGGLAAGQSAGSALPLDNLGLEHLDIVVPDTAASAEFYMRVFRTALHQQEFRGGIRYFVLLGDLPADRQVGYVAIGAGGERPPAIGHYCTLAERYDREAVADALEAAGYSAGGGGGFGMLPDPDGLELQLFEPPAGLVTAAVPSDLPVESGGLVTPVGVDHLLLRVSDLDRSLPYYRLVYGPEAIGPRQDASERIWINLEADTRIGLEPAGPGESPRIAHYAIKVEPFDRDAVVTGLEAIGAEVLPSPDEPEVVRFRDNYGITVELKAA